MNASTFVYAAVMFVFIAAVMSEVTMFLRSFSFAFSIPSDVRLEYSSAVEGMQVIEARKVSKTERRTFSERRYLAFQGYFESSLVFHGIVTDKADRQFDITPSIAVGVLSAVALACSDMFSYDALALSFLGTATVFASTALKGYLKQLAKASAEEKHFKLLFNSVK